MHSKERSRIIDITNQVSAYFDLIQVGSNAPFGVPRPLSLPAADPSYDICFLPKVQRSYHLYRSHSFAQ
jgi:hypothetical protein